MKVPDALYLDCPNCGEKTLHKILKGKVQKGKNITLDAVVRCSRCKGTHKALVKELGTVPVPIIVSWQEESEKKCIELHPEEEVSVGDEFMLDGRVIVKSLESEGKRVQKALVKEIDTIWAKKHDRVVVKASLNRGRKSWSRELEVIPEEEFFIGEILTFGKLDAVVHRIKTRNRALKTGSACADEIERIYCKVIRKSG